MCIDLWRGRTEGATHPPACDGVDAVLAIGQPRPLPCAHVRDAGPVQAAASRHGPATKACRMCTDRALPCVVGGRVCVGQVSGRGGVTTFSAYPAHRRLQVASLVLAVLGVVTSRRLRLEADGAMPLPARCFATRVQWYSRPTTSSNCISKHPTRSPRNRRSLCGRLLPY